MTPEPMRGKSKNESSFVKYVYNRISEIFNIEMPNLQQILIDNASKMFNIKE
jgi:Tat protein secretion system quality control protein TatD with DNase activity